MAGTTCARCKRATFPTAGTLNLRTILPLCDDCADVVRETQLPEIREAVARVINGG